MGAVCMCQGYNAAVIKNNCHVFRVQCLISTGDYDTAVALLRRAVKLEPDNKVIE